MNWPYLTRRDIGGILLAIVILGVALLASVFGPQITARMNYGHGPEWNCSFPGKGDAVCVKRVTNGGAPN
jgi:hypothetical protein